MLDIVHLASLTLNHPTLCYNMFVIVEIQTYIIITTIHDSIKMFKNYRHKSILKKQFKMIDQNIKNRVILLINSYCIKKKD